MQTTSLSRFARHSTMVAAIALASASTPVLLLAQPGSGTGGAGVTGGAGMTQTEPYGDDDGMDFGWIGLLGLAGLLGLRKRDHSTHHSNTMGSTGTTGTSGRM